MKIFIFFIPAFLFVTLNFYLSSLTWSEVRNNINFVRKIPQTEQIKPRHVIQYCVLSFSMSYGLSKTFLSLNSNKVFFLSVISTGLSGALEEFHQKFVPSRKPALIDVFWNFLGALLGAFLFRLIDFLKPS